jgi:hypothetical protein
MKIKLKEISIRELTQGYEDNGQDGVFGYNGKLDIRPPYQREFIYKPEQRDKVIDTINKNFPLNVMYWAVKEDGKYEVIDGQQRTISICQFFNGDFAFNFRYFHNLNQQEKDIFLKYKLMVYLCSGTETEKLKWFETINISGEPLTKQELRNAVFTGSWINDAKKHFSKNGCPAYLIGNDYLNGTPLRQDYLETAIDWISNGNIIVYMGNHQHDPNASALWIYFQSVITWVSSTFTEKRKFMKGVNWGELYNKYKDVVYDTKKLEKETQKLILDDDVTKKSGIYPYLLTKDEKHLSIRSFSEGIKHKVYIVQKGKCKKCGKKFDISEMEADHIDPWHSGGKTTEGNCQLLCKSDNRRKSGI